MKKYRVASRASPLALAQSSEAHASIKLDPNQLEILTIQSYGDLHPEIPLLNGTVDGDFFTRELDQAVLDGRVDWAVHSAKDLPYPLPNNLRVIALLPARHQGDVLVCGPALHQKAHQNLDGGLEFLPLGARIGTSSPQRQSQLQALRPDCMVVSVRGTIAQRIALVDAGTIDACIIARCALERLGLEARISHDLPFATHPLQGHLAIVALAQRRDLRSLWSTVDVRQHWGRVSLVGAGPGDRELLTIKAHKAIQEAEVILHDALIDAAILPKDPQLEIIFVGKRKGLQSHSQDQINQMLYEHALRGKRVLRLKGGDPFIFGRGGEELRFLEERLIDIEVIPGISSAQAAACGMGISFTDRSSAASLALCTGYPAERIQVPTSDTRVYYMPSSNLQLIAEKHQVQGFAPDSPVALIQNISLPDQEWRLESLDSLAHGLGLEQDDQRPLMAIFGSVLPKTRPSTWWDRRWRLWYTGTDPTALIRQGFDRRHPEGIALKAIPLIQTELLSPSTDFDTALANLLDYDWLFLTSPTAIEVFFTALFKAGLDSRSLARCRLAVVGKASARRLANYGLTADLIPDQESGLGLAEAFLALNIPAPVKILNPGSQQALPFLSEALQRAGHQVKRLATYRSIGRVDAPLIDLDQLDEVLLSSPSAVGEFFRWFPKPPADLVLTGMGEASLAAIAQARNQGFK